MKAEKAKAVVRTKPAKAGAKGRDLSSPPEMALQAEWKLKKVEESKKGPLTALREKAPASPSTLQLKNILVPTDFSDASRKALDYAASLAKRVGGKITLVHVIEPLPDHSNSVDPIIMGSDFWQTQAKKAFRKLCEEGHVTESLLRTPVIREGPPHFEITEAARELEADLIIIATNGRTGLAHVLLGSTTERVVRHAPCPVLVVREKEHEFIRS